MKSLKDFGKSVTAVQAYIVALSTTGPLVQVLVGWGPPWPEKTSVGILTAFIQVFVLMFGMLFWAEQSLVRTKQAFLAATLVAAALGVSYIVFFATYTLLPTPGNMRVVIGTTFNEHIPEYLAIEYQNDLKRMIFENGVEKIYESQGLLVCRWGILLLWSCLWAAVSLAITSFIIAQGSLKGSQSAVSEGDSTVAC